MQYRLSGLVAAFTPMQQDGSLHLGMVKPIVEHLLHSGVGGLYVCGSTGEGPLLTALMNGKRTPQPTSRPWQGVCRS